MGGPITGADVAPTKPASPPAKQPVQLRVDNLYSQTVPVIASGVVARFVQRGNRIRAEVPADVKAQSSLNVTVDLPHTADGFVRVQPENTSLGIEFAAKGIQKGVQVETADGLVTYPGAMSGGGDMVLRVSGDLVEDFVVLEQKPEKAVIDYSVKVGEVAGLRHYANSVEFLESNGNPLIRVRPPEVIDAAGIVHKATLALPDCKADTSPLPPWDRPVTAPGKSQCTLRVTWDDAGVVYPAIVDPVWVAATNLLTARWKNAGAKLNSNGFVLVCGGQDANGDTLAGCEVFNPGANAGLGSWAAAATMKKPRSQFTMLSIGNDVLAVGDNSYGAGATSYTSELLSAGTWVLTLSDYSAGSFSPPTLHPVLTSDNLWVVLVDYNGNPYRYSVVTKAWSAGASNGFSRQSYITLPIPGAAAIMRCGGYSGSTAYKTCEKYTPATNTWVMPATAGAVPDMSAARGDPAWAQIDSGRIIVYGGYNQVSGSSISTGEIYSGAGNSWTTTTSISNTFSEGPLHNSWAVHTGSGRILTIPSYSVNVYDPTSNSWGNVSTSDSQGNYFNPMPYGYSAVVSAGSKVLLVPVQPSGQGGYGAYNNCRLFDVVPKGGPCQATADCATGLTCSFDWNDPTNTGGICCETDCTATDRCSSCKAANKTSGTADGTCGPRKVQQYVGYDFCPQSSQSTCGNTGGFCDGAGGCEKWSAAYSCGNGSCVDEDTQNDVRYCTGQGACETQGTTNCNTGYKCMFDSQCVTYCNSDDYCTSGYYCNHWEPPYQECTAKKANGQACNSTSQCQSGNCVDGYCCDDACDGLCEACSNSLTGQTDGSCKPITVAAGPQYNDCYDAGSWSCGQTSLCDGAGACQLYANGTQCADIGVCASETARYIPDTCNGSGACVDKGMANCAVGYSCQNGSCNTQCTSDGQCASNYWCDTVNKVCVADRGSGQSCARDAVCSGNANCIDGVCCDSSCAGSCRSCLKARTGLASDGLCGNILDDTDPENECTQGAAYPNSCAAPGLCNGQGACRPYAKVDVECDTDVCTGSTLTTYACNGAGTCKPKSTQCYPFKCDTTNNVCKVACAEATQLQDCVDGSFCSNGTCVGQLPNGSPCTGGPQCETGFCANVGEGVLEGEETGEGGAGAGGAANDSGADSPGVCCNADCGATCYGCKASIKGFGSDGICEAVRNNTDPANDCEPAVGDVCGLDGTCDGGGNCRLAPQGTSCGQSSCVGNAVLGQRCNGSGACIDNEAGTDCEPYVCRDVNGAFGCTNPCMSDDDCRDGYYCTEAACKKKLANGQACETSAICNSGYCVDGVCCDASCNGQCEACGEPGSEGVCIAIEGQPRGSRTECDFAGEECGGSCDGVNAAACKYAPTGTECGTPTCTNAVADSSACDGSGSCRPADPERCLPYACGDDDKCLTTCALDDECSPGFTCDEAVQTCVPASVSAECSEDGLDSVGQNGIKTPCKPFLCVASSGTCAVSCAFTTDCAPEFVCEASTKTCLPAPPDAGTGPEEGCACRAAGAPTRFSHHYLALVALGLAAAGLRRRRRPQLSE